jgi:E3 ubiquitin-protein ligase RAD18
MNKPEYVSDPSDWEKSKFPQLNELDAALRCQICKEFLKAPVLTTCGHIFCSICIRRTISDSNKCPVCLDETYESGLRKVLLLDSIVSWFGKNRAELLNALPLDHVNDSQNDDDSDIEVVTANGSAPKTDTKDATNKDETLTECPICGVFMPITEIQGKHIDQCLKDQTNGSAAKATHSTKQVGMSGFFSTKVSPKKVEIDLQLQPKSVKGKQRLANLDTSLSASKLKERMSALRIPTNGTRQQLEHRMKEYINLFNANLDSINPVDERILRDRLNKWEALISSKTSLSVSDRVLNSPPITYDQQTIKRQKVERKKWNETNKSHYADLIKSARQNMQKRKSVEARIKQEEEMKQNVKPSIRSLDEDFPDDDFTEIEKEFLS